MTWYLVGSLAAILTSFGFMPQVIKIWRTKSVGDVSPLTFAQFAVGTLLWTLYSVHLKDPVLITANLVMLSTVVLGLILYLRFSEKRNL